MDKKDIKTKRKTKSKDILLKTNDKKIKTNDLKVNELNENESKISPYFESIERLSKHFFVNKSCIELSKALLGQILCRRLPPNGPTLKGRIVETEAYLGLEDKACNTYGGRRTEGNEPMYMSSGTCYVYFTYGMYHCFNVSAEDEGAAVLLRAIEPLEGIDSMQRLRSEARKGKGDNSKPYKPKMLGNGPSKLCMAFGITKNNTNKEDITESDIIWIEKGESVCDTDIVCSKRIGINRGDEWIDKELRFYIRNNDYISRK